MPAKTKRPNILIFFTDQQRADTVGAYGAPMGLTPHLDGMAQCGVRFESAVTSQPVCGPARGCLMTGQYATTHGVWRNGLGIRPDAVTLAGCLKEAGYTTAYIGKWHLSDGKNEGRGAVPPKYRGGFVDHWQATNSLESTAHPYEGSMWDGDGNEISFRDTYRADWLAELTERFLRDVCKSHGLRGGNTGGSSSGVSRSGEADLTETGAAGCEPHGLRGGNAGGSSSGVSRSGETDLTETGAAGCEPHRLRGGNARGSSSGVSRSGETDLTETGAAGPFFLMVSYIEPHQQNDMHRMVAPDGYAEKYRNPFVPQDLRPFPGDWQQQLPDYYGCVARLDECFGRTLGVLSDLGILDDTIVVFHSDHGCHFRTRNGEYKRSCHESSVRVPLVVRGPGFERAQTIPELVSTVDMAPTLLEAAGVPVPSTTQGHSFLPLLDGRTDDWRNEAFIQVSESMVGRALRTERWKYCVVAPHGKGGEESEADLYVDYQLYDLHADPFELMNLAGRNDYREVADGLRERLVARMVEAGEREPKILPAPFYP